MLKWGGDYSLPRLRAKLATTGAGTEHAEPDYAEVYRPDLGQSTILRKESPEFFAAVAENGGFEAFARSSGYRGLNKGLSRSSLWKTGSTTAPKSSQTFGQTTMSQTTQMGLNQTMLRTRSVPTLGSRTVERAPAHSQPFPPTWHVSSTSSLPGIVAAKQALTTAGPPVDDPKEKQAEVASKKLWTAIHGSEYLVQEEVAALQKEGQPNNQAFLAKLNKSDSRFPGIKKALKAGAKVDWRNPEWDGATLLIRAARTGSLELAMFCLSQSASIQERDNSGRGVLHWAALSGNNCLMQYLLTEYSLDVSSPDGSGDSPLHLGAYAGHIGVVRLLVHAGAKETANANGFTPLQLAEAKRMWHVVRYLRENNSDESTKDRLGHILRYLKENKEDAEKEEVPLRELAFRSCNLAKANSLLAISSG